MVKRFAMFALLLSIFVMPALVATGAASAQGNSEAAYACQQGGYLSLQGTDGTRFVNTGQCVRFAALGGELTEILPQSLNLSFTAVPDTRYCGIAVELVSFPANSEIPVEVKVNARSYYPVMTTNAIGYVFDYPIGTFTQMSGAVVTVSAGGLTAGPSVISC